ncbi:TonB-dependent siderophore receptor [Zoogloea sp. LCSB751]|uniref:TonB-dependent receptor plug domain-containing protein n=1 Tax=Zoogloea sp. LCSB751 TaxID=1965277 RepID=UPI0009A4C256|nr:TonB-dependent receptor [Zoogloea sp. LCSB751]
MKKRHSKDFSRLAITVAVAGVCGPVQFVWAADPPEADQVSLEPVVVLGTARRDLKALESSAPVDVIGREKLLSTGAVRLDQALQALSPSFNFPQGGYVNNGVKAATLRGLSPDQVLILVDGKRRHASAGVNTSGFGRGAQPADLSTIPISAIDHIEILRDGASAQYGSDALAGVINVVLRKAASGAGIAAQTGVYGANSGELNNAVNGWFGTSLGDDGFLTVSFDTYRERHPESGVTDPRQWYFNGDPREATARKDKVKWAYLPDRDSYNLLVNGETGIGGSARAYAVLSYSNSDNDAPENFIPPNDRGNVRALYPDGFQPHGLFTKDDFSLSTGIKFGDDQLGHFDLSTYYGTNTQKLRTSPSVNATLGLASPRAFDISTRVNELRAYSLDYTRELPVAGLAKPLNLAAGVSHRRERFHTKAGEYGSWANGGVLILDGPSAGQVPSIGSRGNTGLYPQDVVDYQRSVTGAYLNLEAQVTEKLQLGAVGRVDEYSDSGTTVNGKGSVRYDFTPKVAVRTSYSTGYRAPALGQSGYAVTGIQAGTGLNFVETRGLPVDNPAARALGATDLRPEKSRDLSVGVVLRPIENASITVDAYQIDIRDRITLSDNLGGPTVTSLLTAAGYPQVTVANFFANGLDTRTTGVDVTGRYRFELRNGAKVDLNAAFSEAHTSVTRVKANPAPLAASGLTLFGRQAIGYIEDAAPRNKWVFGQTYRQGKWRVTATETRYGTYVDRDASNPVYDQTYSAQWIADLEVGYAPAPGWQLAAGALNLFNSYPDKQIPQRRTLGQTEYSPLSPAGYDGAFYYVRVAYQFQ